MIILKQHYVPESVSNIRLVDYALSVFKNEIPSKSGIKKAIKRGEILVNGVKTDQGTWVEPGQSVEYVDLDNKSHKVFEFKLKVVFEDDHFAVINKPAGISVSGNKYKTIVNALTFNLGKSTEKDVLNRPQPVHRLDYPTSGLLLVAKTKTALFKLGKQFEQRKIKKEYLAIVVGKTPDKGIVDIPVAEQEAVTEYKLVEAVPSLKTVWITLVKLHPLTGRTHQLRYHMSEIGCPIIGDKKYGKNMPVLEGKGLFLCATCLEFIHPATKKQCSFQIDQPVKFTSLIKREKRRWKKYHVQ